MPTQHLRKTVAVTFAVLHVSAGVIDDILEASVGRHDVWAQTTPPTTTENCVQVELCNYQGLFDLPPNLCSLKS